jgi:hypothetical protein
VWMVDPEGESERETLTGAAVVNARGELTPPRGAAPRRGVTIQPIVPCDGIVAVALVNAAPATGVVTLNGSPAANGLHPLRHADRLEVAGRTLWIVAESDLLRVRYAADQHGPEVRCGLTKARLREGQEVVICPGVPGTPCGVVYGASAWDAVIQANPRMKCTRCGYRSGQAAWQPPVPKPRKELLDGLRQLALRD